MKQQQCWQICMEAICNSSAPHVVASRQPRDDQPAEDGGGACGQQWLEKAQCCMKTECIMHVYSPAMLEDCGWPAKACRRCVGLTRFELTETA